MSDQNFADVSENNEGNTGVSVHAGFPNAAADRTRGQALDFNSLLIRNPSSTFMFRIRGSGDSAVARGIFDGDIAVIDRALDPRPGDLIIRWDESGFALSTYRGPAGGEIRLWGVITAIIHETRSRRSLP